MYIRQRLQNTGTCALSHPQTHTLVLRGPGFVKVTADGALGRLHRVGASC